MELYFFSNYSTVIKTRSPGCSLDRSEISTTRRYSSNAKKVRLHLYEAVIKCAQENGCAELMQALVLQLVVIRSDLAHWKNVLPCIMTLIPPWTASSQRKLN